MKSLQGFSSGKDKVPMKAKNKGDSSGYAYTNTRVRAMKSKLLKDIDFHKMMKMSLDEIARFLEETEYKKEIDSLALKYSGVNLIETGLNKNLENSFRRVFDFSIQASREQIQLYLERFDLWCIKTVLRGKFANVSDEEILNGLIAVGKFRRSFFENVIRNSKGLNPAVEMFKETEYYPILKKFSGNLGKMEDELDKYYYEKVLSLSEKELRDFSEFEIGTLNALSKFRSKHLAIKLELLPDGKNLDEIVSKSSNAIEAEKILKKKLVEKGLKMLNKFQRSIGPVLAYFIAKQNEVDNIRIIARGKHSGLDDKIIEEQLVIA